MHIGKHKSSQSGGFLTLGFGFFLLMLGLFIPGEGILFKGILAPLALFVVVGIACMVIGVLLILGVFHKKDSNKEVEIIVQQKGTPAILMVGGVALFMGVVATLLGVFTSEIGIIDKGLYSDLMFWVIVGAVISFIGIIVSIGGFINLRDNMIYKKLETDSMCFTTVAKYIDNEIREEELLIKDDKYLPMCIEYEYMDETGTLRRATSLDEYFLDGREWFKQKGTFKIRCRGKYSIIIENYLGEKVKENEDRKG